MYINKEKVTSLRDEFIRDLNSNLETENYKYNERNLRDEVKKLYH